MKALKLTAALFLLSILTCSAQTKDILEINYLVYYNGLEYETTNQTEYINTLQDAIEFLHSDFENSLISENDFNRINNKFTNELNKYNLL